MQVLYSDAACSRLELKAFEPRFRTAVHCQPQEMPHAPQRHDSPALHGQIPARRSFSSDCCSAQPSLLSSNQLQPCTTRQVLNRGWLQISDTVYPMYKAFIEPDLAKAHLRISNTFNPFSGFMDATYILKSAKHVTVQDIRAAVPVGAQPAQVIQARSRPCACRQRGPACAMVLGRSPGFHRLCSLQLQRRRCSLHERSWWMR